MTETLAEQDVVCWRRGLATSCGGSDGGKGTQNQGGDISCVAFGSASYTGSLGAWGVAEQLTLWICLGPNEISEVF